MDTPNEQAPAIDTAASLTQATNGNTQAAGVNAPAAVAMTEGLGGAIVAPTAISPPGASVAGDAGQPPEGTSAAPTPQPPQPQTPGSTNAEPSPQRTQSNTEDRQRLTYDCGCGWPTLKDSTQCPSCLKINPQAPVCTSSISNQQSSIPSQPLIVGIDPCSSRDMAVEVEYCKCSSCSTVYRTDLMYCPICHIAGPYTSQTSLEVGAVPPETAEIPANITVSQSQDATNCASASPSSDPAFRGTGATGPTPPTPGSAGVLAPGSPDLRRIQCVACGHEYIAEVGLPCPWCDDADGFPRGETIDLPAEKTPVFSMILDGFLSLIWNHGPLIMLAILVAWLLVMLTGCEPKPGQLGLAQDNAAGVQTRLDHAASQVDTHANGVISDAQKGQTLTPTQLQASLNPIWSSIVRHGDSLVQTGNELTAMHGQMDTLRGQIEAGRKELDLAKASLEAEKEARKQDKIAAGKKLSEANSQWERIFQKVTFIALLAVGISVFVGVWSQDFKIAVAGAAGGAAVIISCMIFGQVSRWIPWIAGSVTAAAVLWIVVEVWMRGSISAAIKTNPVQDIEDLVQQLVGKHLSSPTVAVPSPKDATITAAIPANLGGQA